MCEFLLMGASRNSFFGMKCQACGATDACLHHRENERVIGGVFNVKTA